MNFVEISPENYAQYGCYCVKNLKAEGSIAKGDWYLQEFSKGLRIIQAIGTENKAKGMIEFVPAENAWRPVLATNNSFIHCLVLFSKADRESGLGSELIQYVINEAKKQGKEGVCTFSSEGAWMASKAIFQKDGFKEIDKKGRFSLLWLPIETDANPPEFIDWEKNRHKIKGWHFSYSNQCPWHKKSAQDLASEAKKQNIELEVIPR